MKHLLVVTILVGLSVGVWAQGRVVAPVGSGLAPCIGVVCEPGPMCDVNVLRDAAELVLNVRVAVPVPWVCLSGEPTTVCDARLRAAQAARDAEVAEEWRARLEFLRVQVDLCRVQ